MCVLVNECAKIYTLYYDFVPDVNVNIIKRALNLHRELRFMPFLPDLAWEKTISAKIINREIKVHVYAKRQTSDSTWEYLRIENKQIKTVQNHSYVYNGLETSYFFLSWSNKQYTTIKGKTWSRGTNLRLPFCVNVNLNLSNKKQTPFKGVTAIMCDWTWYGACLVGLGVV